MTPEEREAYRRTANGRMDELAAAAAELRDEIVATVEPIIRPLLLGLAWIGRRLP